MADKRKLQAEIEKCLKKVTEGIETFDEIWQKVHSAANANQKEKYEADLKKEIKKLQRLRDNIKTWMQSNDIKDKKILADARKSIETRMERFKIIERETKTKAYSKEGLGLATKVDPAQKEKDEIRQWLTDSIDQLQMQIDQYESEIESVSAGAKRKKLDRDRQDRVDELATWVERHKYHILKLETIMRMLDNCSLEVDEIKTIQDDLQYYLECNQEPDFTENELIYEDLNLEEGLNVMAATYYSQNNEEEENSIASSPTSSGPLSPKTPNNVIKSSSLELFSERRRGKTSSTGSDIGIEPVPSSPRRPGPKSLPLNLNSPSSSNSKSSNSNSPKLQGPLMSKSTPTSRTPTQPTSGPLLQTKATTPGNTKVQSLSAYAIAAGGNQSSLTMIGSNNSTSMSVITTTASPLPPHEILSLTDSQSPPTSSSSSSIPLTTLPNNRLQDSSIMSQECHSSSTSSSLSPSSIITSQDSNGQVQLANNNSESGSIHHASQESNLSGPPSQTTNSPNLSTYMGVSGNTSPNGSPASQQTSALSPMSMSISSTLSSVPTPGTFSRSDSGTCMPPPGSTAPVVMSVVPGGLMSVPMITSNNNKTQVSGTDLMFGSSMPALPLSGNPPSVVTSFSLQSALQSTDSSSFSPSLGSIGVSSVSGNGNTGGGISMDSFGFSTSIHSKERNSGWPSPPMTESTIGMTSLKDIAAGVVAHHDLLEGGRNKENLQLPTSEHQTINMRPSLLNAAPGSRMDIGMLSSSTSTHSSRGDNQMQPLLGVAPLGPVPLNQDRMYQLKMLEAVFKRLPEPSDSERVRPYLQRTPYPTPSYHHQHPPGHMDSFEFYQRLSIEPLFFIFYYMEGTKAQYMAAKALKKLSWRFHTKYMTWFQRLEEPKTITDDYEMGTYIYFDYEKWAQRKKDGFTFEYRYLEDRELP